jgi:hypothetical protein
VWFVSRDALLRLHQLTDADRAPPDPSLCVEGRAPVARRLAGRLAVDPGLATKCLLYGARGGGKSTQMHDLKRRLSGVFEVIDVDLDRSGVAIAGLTAFDLMYIVGVAALRLVTGNPKAQDVLHQALARAYVSEDQEREQLGKVDQALDGIVGFGEAAVMITAAVGGVTVPAAIAVGAIKGAKHGLRLRRGAKEVVAATSPPGRQMQDAVEAAFEAARGATGRKLAVLIDGLEKVNGGAAAWMRETFEHTRLLTDTSVTMVVAAPPCPFTDTNAAADVGWRSEVVYGFAPRRPAVPRGGHGAAVPGRGLPGRRRGRAGAARATRRRGRRPPAPRHAAPPRVRGQRLDRSARCPGGARRRRRDPRPARTARDGTGRAELPGARSGRPAASPARR